jgi:hypothetical protein
MTAVRTNTDFKAPVVIDTMFQRSLGVGLLFGVGSMIAAVLPGTREQFFHAYLMGFMLWLGAALGSMAILMIQHMTGGMWGMVIRRQLEAAMKTLPLMGLLFIPIVAAGMPHLYGVWLHPDPKDKHLVEMSHEYLMRGGTAQFLFLDGFIGRAIVYFAIWLGLAFILNRWSEEQDNPPVQNLSPRFRKVAAPGLILYAFTISFAVIDWIMSLDPHWISTIFGFIFIVGELITAICLMVVIERILMRYEPMAALLKPKEVHDHGKLMLTFIMLWAYFSFSQLLIIWAGNLPTEITFFTRRLYSGWQAIGLALVVFHFAVPFLLLLSRPFKREPRTLVWLASWLIFMRFVDLYWYIEPNFSKTVHLNWLALVVPVAIGGFWMAMFLHNLRSRPLLPAYDMHAQEFLEYAGVGHD